MTSDFVRSFLEGHGIEARPPTAFTGDGDIIIPNGARNDTLASIYGLLLKAHIAPNIARAMLRGVGTDPAAVAEPMHVDEIDAIAEHLAGRGSAEPFDAPWYSLTRITLESRIKPLSWLIPGVVPGEGITLIHGLPAQGKSYTAQDIYIAVNAGVPALGRDYTPVRKRGAYFDWERRGEMFTRRSQQLARGHGLRSLDVDYYEVRRPLAGAIEGIRELVALHGYEFAIFDSLSIAIMTADLLSAHEVIPQMFAMHEIGIPIICLDHQSKPVGGQDIWNASAFGSIFKSAVASMVWQCGKTDPNAFNDDYMEFKLHHKKNNFDLNPADVCMKLELGDDSIRRITSIEELSPMARLIDEMGSRTDATLSQISAFLGFGASKSREVVQQAITAGVIRVVYQSRGGAGRPTTYALVDNDEIWAHPDTPETEIN